jgi:hypothetical protein
MNAKCIFCKGIEHDGDIDDPEAIVLDTFTFVIVIGMSGF